jgi:hypothetical protein
LPFLHFQNGLVGSVQEQGLLFVVAIGNFGHFRQ